MKYYCENCGTELVIGEHVDTTNLFDDGMMCPFDLAHGEMCIVPDYETPQQYEERTGKAYPYNGLVFLICHNDDCEHADYCEVSSEWGASKADIENGSCTAKAVIADPPVPPPDDWRPDGY
jgi:hypothetical protein